METILIPVDFSEKSKGIFEYGMQLAKEMNAALIILHVYNIPVSAGDGLVEMPSYLTIEEDNSAFLKEFERELSEKYAFTNPIESLTISGFLIEEIAEIAAEKKVDLIIMGIHEAGKLAEFFLGSTSIRVIKKTSCPILIIPEGAVYRPINTIVFACSDIGEIIDTNAINQVSKFTEFFNSKLLILNAVESFEKIDFQKTLFESKNLTVFENIDYSIHFLSGENLINNINDFIENNNADLLIMIPKKHPLFSNLFQESNTKKMAFHSHIPLLAIHE